MSNYRARIELVIMAGLVMLAVRWIIAGVFLRSGLGKSVSLGEFRSAVANYRLLPGVLVAPVAYTLPFAEIGAAILLALGVLTVVVAAALALLLVTFAAAIAINLARGRVFDCGCAGSVATPQLISWRHVGVDLALGAVAAAVAAVPPPADLWRGPGGLTTVAMPAGGVFPVLLSVVLLLGLVVVIQRATNVLTLTRAARDILDAGTPPSREP